VKVELPGFRTEVRSGLTLTVSQEAVVNLTLQAGAAEQTVIVARQVFAGAAAGEAPVATAEVINWTGSARSRQQFALKLLF